MIKMNKNSLPASGRRLYELRTAMGISLEEAAGLMKISKTTLWRYEHTETLRLGAARTADICRIYRVSAAELCTDAAAFCAAAGDTGGSTPLSEEAVAEAYRNLDERGRLRVSRILKGYGGQSS